MNIDRRASVPYSATQMFDLVNDIESYPKFLHWCNSARVDHRFDDRLEATIDVGARGVHKRFSTRNTLNRPHRIDMKLLAGPFRQLEGAWTFTDRPEGGCEVRLTLSFQVSHSPLNMLFAVLFEELVRSQISAFTERAKVLYG